MKQYLGIDLGGTNIAVGLVTEDGTLGYKDSVPTGSERGVPAVLQTMIDLCQKVLADSGVSLEEITAIGIGSPGRCDTGQGIIKYAANLGFRQVEVCKVLGEALGRPVYLANDADCAALGEYVAGAAKGASSSITVTLGTGLGGGVIVGDRLVNSELGHMTIQFNGELCTCGNRGCWEAYVSATALIRQAKEAAREHPRSRLALNAGGDLERIDGKAVFDAADQGDETARAVIVTYCRYLAIGLANLIDVLLPDVIVLGGGISARGDEMLAPITELVREAVFGQELTTKLAIATLGNDAGIIGAALLGRGVGLQ